VKLNINYLQACTKQYIFKYENSRKSHYQKDSLRKIKEFSHITSRRLSV